MASAKWVTTFPAGGQNQVGYNSYSRDSYAIPKKRRKWPFVVLAVVLVLLLAAGGVAFAGVVYMNSLNDKLQNNIDDELKATLSSEAVQQRSVFIASSWAPTLEERRESGAYGDTFRSDSMILARIDPRQKTVALVSIERDTYVNIEGYGPNKLNTSPRLAVPSVEHGIDVCRCLFPIMHLSISMASRTSLMPLAALRSTFLWKSTTPMPVAMWMLVFKRSMASRR